MRVDFLGAARVIDNFIGGVMEPYSYEDYCELFKLLPEKIQWKAI